MAMSFYYLIILYIITYLSLSNHCNSAVVLKFQEHVVCEYFYHKLMLLPA